MKNEKPLSNIVHVDFTARKRRGKLSFHENWVLRLIAVVSVLLLSLLLF